MSSRFSSEFGCSDSFDSGSVELRVVLEKAAKELNAERNKRVEAENVFKDVQRECKEPSVVPALRKALLELPSPSTSLEA